MTLKFAAKLPNEVEYFAVDWANQLVDATLESGVWIIPDHLTEENSLIDGTKHVILLSGGVGGMKYYLVSRVTLSNGEIKEEEVLLPVSLYKV
jgi:hypothetical protein